MTITILYLDGTREDAIPVRYVSAYPAINNKDCQILYIELLDQTTRHIELDKVMNFWLTA